MTPDAETWERLNAYHDGELDRREAAALRAEIDQDATLQAALDDIGELSAALKPLRPSAGLVSRLPRPDVRRLSAGFIPAAAAAVAIIAGALLYNADFGVKSPLDWHHDFTSRSYPVAEQQRPTPVSQWIGNDLDLSAANLTLVDVITLDSGGTYLHYAGVNGCRLTVGALSSPPDLPVASDRLLVHAWTVGLVYYSVLAEGMDRAKFAAISYLLAKLTENNSDEGAAVVALRKATYTAIPCA